MSLTNNKWLLIVGIIPIVIVVVAITSRFLHKPKPTTLTSIPNPQITTSPQPQTAPSAIHYTGGSIDIPPAMLLYKSSGPISLSVLTTNIATTLNLTLNPHIANFWTNSTSTTALMFDEQRGLIQLTYASNQPSNQTVNQSQSIQTALNHLDGLGFNTHPKQVLSTQFFTGISSLTPTTNPTVATTIAVGFGEKIQNLPTYYNSQNTPPFLVFLSNNQVTKVEISTYSQISPTNLSIQTKSFNSIKQDLLNQRGQIIATNFEDALTTPNPRATLNQASLEYRYSSELDLFVPYVRFSGNSDVDSELSPIEIIVPAVNTQASTQSVSKNISQ